MPRHPAFHIVIVLLACLTGLGTCVGSFAAEPPPTRQLAFSPDGRKLAAAFGLPDQPGMLVIWNWETGEPVAVHREDVGVATVSFSPSGDRLAIGMFGPAAKILSPETGEIIREFRGHTGYARSVAFINEDMLATGSYDRTVRLWDAATGEQIVELGSHHGEVREIAAAPDGKWLLSGASSPDVRLWNIDERRQQAEFKPSNLICPIVLFSPDGTLFVTGRWDATVRIRDTASHKPRATVRSNSRGIALTPDNRALLVVNNEPTIRHFPLAFDPPSDDLRRRIESLIAAWDDDDYQKREQASRDMIALGPAAEPQLRKAMQSDDPEIRIRARRARASVLSPEAEIIDVGHGTAVGAITVSPDGRHVATGDAAGAVKVWKLRGHELVADLLRPE